jgi:hypothetical protein
VVFCVFNWHDELLRAQMDDDWTANILCVLFAKCYLSLGERLPTQNQNSPLQAKKRDFSMTLVFGALGAKRTLFVEGQPLTLPEREPKKSRFVQNKTKQNENNTKTHQNTRDMKIVLSSISPTTKTLSLREREGQQQRRMRRTSSTRASTSCSSSALKKTTTRIKGQQQNTFFAASSSSSGPLEKHERKHTVETRRRRDDAKKKVVVRAMPPPSSSGHPAETLLDESRGLYEQGERMQGYKKLEQAMKLDEDASLPVRREIRYQAMCCVAAFGDVEMAKQYLREMELLGLPYDVAINDPSLMRMESSALMRNQLKKFASGSEKSFGTVQREVYERTKKTLPGGPGGDAPIVNKGLMELEIDDNTDASVGGIAKRVGGVVLASIGGFALLFFAGLKLIQESGY